MRKIAAIAAAAALLCAAETSPEGIAAYGASLGNYRGKIIGECIPIQTFVMTLKVIPPEDMIAEFEKVTGQKVPPRSTLHAFWVKTNDGMHFIIVPQITKQNDRLLTAWGHELAHVACGHYHP